MLSSCNNKKQESIGDKEIVVFDNTPLNFKPGVNKTNLDDDIIKIDNGRIVLRKINLPKYNKEVKVSVEAEIVSAGDPWDKTGSIFLIPSTSELNFLIENDKFKELFSGKNKEEDFFPGIVAEGDYKPSIEVLRFMTPFGVGYYSKSPKLEKRRPVYIPKWEDKVVWKEDVTQLLSELEGEVWIASFVDVWTDKGYKISVKLNYEESKAEVHTKTKREVIPLVNTVRYIEPEKLYDGFNRGDINLDFEITDDVKSAKLYYITTGHGGHSGGDEFVKKKNIVKVDGVVLYSDVPWRDDCASFRRFNPHSGVWTEKRMATTGNLRDGDTKDEEIEEFIASSDYSRSNWCPGSKVEPIVLDLKDLSKGKHSLTISIPEAQKAVGDKLNHWNVSAYIVIEK